MGTDNRTGRDELEEALLAFQLMPGKYALALREPHALFAGMAKVLHVAGGKPSQASGAAPSPLVRQAACFFIRSALLHPGADHYTLLGLPRDAEAATVKEHYRLLMRLMHPDFSDASGRSPWPADAAARVNRAYEVLASAVQRREYDESLAAEAEPQPTKKPEPVRLRGQAVRRAGQPAPADRRGPLKRLAGVFGAVGGIALLLLVLGGGPEKDMLVQRSAPALTGRPAEPAPSLAAIAAPKLDAPPELASVAVATPARGMQLHAAQQLGRAQPAKPVAAALSKETNPRDLRVAAMPPARTAPSPVLQVATIDSLAATPLLPAPEPRPIAAFVSSPRAAAPAAPAAPPAAAAAAPAPQAGLTLAEAHPVLARMLQQLETGQGEGMLSLLERDARSAPAAQALVRYYAGLVEGTRPIRIANAHFRAEPREGRLLVTGLVQIQLGDTASPKELAMQAEFVSRGGAVVMTRLARAPGDKVE